MKFIDIAKLTAWVLPRKEDRIRYKDFCHALDLRKDLEKTQNNYKNIVERLKNKKDKIKVVFLIRENQKWTYQSVYEEFAKSGNFEPLVLVSILNIVAKGKDKTRNNLEENYEFFKSQGMNVDYAYKNGEFVDLKEFKPDIVFYDQPWELPEIHEPRYVSDFALTCYCSYSYELINNPEHYFFSFHKFLYRFFVDNELNLKRYESYKKGNAQNCVVTGYLKLDSFHKMTNECDIWKDKNKIKIIYAPHHSFKKNGIQFGTFDRNGKFILDLAKQHPETTWVFKPHPRFKYALLRNNIMAEDEIEEYYRQWENIGAIYDLGDYIPLFISSDLMITDSVSFLAEYLPSKKPLIRLINKHSMLLNELGEKICKLHYCVNTNEELTEIFNFLLKNNVNSKELNLNNEILKTVYNQEELVSEKILSSFNFIGEEK